MPQSGTGVSVEAVDPVFQTKMLDMLKQVGRCVGLDWSVGRSGRSMTCVWEVLTCRCCWWWWW